MRPVLIFLIVGVITEVIVEDGAGYGRGQCGMQNSGGRSIQGNICSLGGLHSDHLNPSLRSHHRSHPRLNRPSLDLRGLAQ